MMDAPVRIWRIKAGTARGMRLDFGETVEFDLAPGDTNPLSQVRPGGHSEPVMIDARRLRPWTPTWGTSPGIP